MTVGKVVRMLKPASITVCIYLAFCLPEIEGGDLQLPTMNVSDLARGTDYITLAWNLSDPDNVIDKWQVTAIDLDYEFIASYEGGATIDPVENTAKVSVHMPDTRYNICLIAYINKTAVRELSVQSVRSCGVYRSIPLLLKSSLIPLVVVVGTFAMLIIMGFLTYKIKQLTIQSHAYIKAESESLDPPQNGLQKNCVQTSNHIEA